MHCLVSLPPLRRHPPGWLRLRLILAALCLGGAAVFAGDEAIGAATPLPGAQARAALQGSAIGRMHRDLLNRSPAGRRCG